MVEVSDFHQKVLRRASSPDELRIYRAGLEWDLTDPIVIESSDDFKSAPRWKDRLTPFHHQVTNLITFCRRLPVTLLADDVGLGKTISAGLVISELASRSRVSKVLVICPKILGPQWQAELTTKFEIPSKFVTGRELLTADVEEFGAVMASRLSRCSLLLFSTVVSAENGGKFSLANRMVRRTGRIHQGPVPEAGPM
jgi:hypothetical protein